MKFALEVWSNDWDAIEATCRRAERLGYDAFYYGESPTGLNLDCWSVLAALARATRDIRIGPVIANLLPSYRSLALQAREAATVAILADGRLDFRTGAGAARRYGRRWWAPFGVDYPAYADRLELLERSLPVLRALWAGGSARLGAAEPVSLGFAPPTIPITLAATGPSGLACAARHADVWEASYRTPDEFARLSARFAREGDGRAVRRSLEVDVFVAPNAEAEKSLLEEVQEQRGAEHAPRVIERALRGTPGEIGLQLARLEAAGVEQLLLAFHDPCDAAALELFAEARDAFESTRPG